MTKVINPRKIKSRANAKNRRLRLAMAGNLLCIMGELGLAFDFIDSCNGLPLINGYVPTIISIICKMKATYQFPGFTQRQLLKAQIQPLVALEISPVAYQKTGDLRKSPVSRVYRNQMLNLL
jgi:hypothetical protein